MSTNALLPLPSVMSMLNVRTLVGLTAADAKLVILEAKKLAKVCVEVVANSFCSEIRISNTRILLVLKFELVARSTSEQLCFELQNNFKVEF